MIGSFKVYIKQRKTITPKVKNSPLLYCEAIANDDNETWTAIVNTKDINKIEGFENITSDTIECPFTERSYELSGKCHIFSKYKRDGKYVHIIRSKDDSILRPGCRITETAISFNEIYSGHIIITDNGAIYFDMKKYVGEKSIFGDILKKPVGTTIYTVLEEKNIDKNEYPDINTTD